MNKWNSVKDKLPTELDIEYICHCTHGNGGDLVIALIWGSEGWGQDNCDEVDWNKYVVDWMEMPVFPESEEKGFIRKLIDKCLGRK